MRGNELLDAMSWLPPKLVEAAEYSPKRRMGMRILAAACVCLMLGGIFAANLLTKQPSVIRINRLDGSMDSFAAYIDIYAEMFTGLPPAELRAVKREFAAVTGISYAAFQRKIPRELSLTRFWAVMTPPRADGSTERSLRDYVFEYQTADGGRLKLSVSAVGKPVRCVILPQSAYEDSVINGVTMQIFAADGEYLAEFSADGLYYSIEARDIDEPLVIDVLEGLAK